VKSFHRYSIVGTETRLIKSSYVDQEFQISVALPVFHSGYLDKKCPVIYMLDANFYFGMVTELSRIMALCSELPDIIIVGIGYPWTEPATDAYDNVISLRLRDYTPVVSKQAEEEILEFSPALEHCESGGAANFFRFIKEELIPIVETEYPIDPTDRTLLGHSWGGTFSLYEMFHSTSFHKYVVCDADVNYGNKILYEYEKAYAETHDSLPVKFFFSSPGESEMLEVLKNRHYKGLEITSHDIQGLRHCEGTAPSFQAGLKAIFRDLKEKPHTA